MSILAILLIGVVALLAVGMVAVLVVVVRAMAGSSARTDAHVAEAHLPVAHASGSAVAEPEEAQGTWYARFTPDIGAVGALVPFSGKRQLGLVRLESGRLEFWPKDAQAPAWVAPVADVRVRLADVAFGRLAEYPLRLDSPQSGALLGEISLEPRNTFGELALKDQRNHEYSRHFAELLVAAGAQRLG